MVLFFSIACHIRHILVSKIGNVDFEVFVSNFNTLQTRMTAQEGNETSVSNAKIKLMDV